jgi:hypothetical protein
MLDPGNGMIPCASAIQNMVPRIVKIVAYVYAAVWLGVGAAGTWMACQPEFYLPPKSHWNTTAMIAFILLTVGQFFFCLWTPRDLPRNPPAPKSDDKSKSI